MVPAVELTAVANGLRFRNQAGEIFAWQQNGRVYLHAP
jgi:hypothetical protein